MTARETNLLNAFETTLTGTIGASDSTMTVNAVVDSAGNQVQADSYLVLNPDSATNREVVLITAVNAGTKQITIGDGGSDYRYLTGSAATSGLSHASGSVVRMAPLQQHIEDINDRVDTIINEAGTAVVTTGVVKDEDNMASNSATHLATQQSIKAYVDTQLGASDLDITTDSGSIDIDLDDDTLTVTGGEGIDTSATGTTLTIAGEDASTSNKGVASFSSDNFAVSSGAVTIKDSGVSNDELAGSIANAKLANSSITVTDGSSSTATALGGTITFSGTSNEVEVAESSGTITIGLPSTVNVNVTGTINATSVLADGVTATTQSAGDNSTKVATTAYVDAIDSDDDLSVSDGSSSTTINLDSQSLTIAGTANEIETTATAQTITISLPATINANTTGNAATATALETARTIGGVSFDGTGNIDLPGVNTAGTQNTSGTAAGLSATLAVASGGTGATSMTDKAVVITQDSGTDTLSSVAMDGNGELLIGGTSGPAVSTLTAGTGITITPGDGSIEISAPDVGDITGVTAGTGLSGGGTSGTVTLNVEASQAITALTGGDLTIYEDANNADVSLKMGTSATESLTIEVLNGSGNKTAEQINFTTATASGTADHGKMVFNVDETTIATIDDGGIDLASGKEFSINGTAIGGSANALSTGDSDFTLTDTGTATGIHYELDNVDTADWNQGGIALTSVGGIFRHSQTQDSTYTVASTEGAVVAGPISIGSSATVTIAGTMVIL